MSHKLVGGRLVGKKTSANLILKYCHLNLEHVEVAIKKKYSEEVTAPGIRKLGYAFKNISKTN